MSAAVGPTTEPVVHVADAPRPARRGRGKLEAYGLVGLTVALAVFFTFLPSTGDKFFTVANMQFTLGNQGVLVLVAFAALMPLVAGQYDFSVGAILGITSIYAASILSKGGSIVVAFAAAMLIGTVIGFVNGLIVTRIRVNSLVATLGTATILHGIIVWKTGGVAIVEHIPQGIGDFGSSTLLSIPLPAWLAVGAAFLAWYVLRLTPFGRYLHAIGSNARAARLVGINTDRLTLLSFALAGFIASLAGLLQLARSGSGNPRVGDGFTLPAFAAVFLSTAAIRPGRFNVWGVVVAIVFLAVLNSGLLLSGASTYVNDLANGGALIVGIALASLLGRNHQTT
jgi:ribose transport system permease protein